MDTIASQTGTLYSGTGDGAGNAFLVARGAPERVYQASIAGSGAVAANVTFQGSNDGSNWVDIGSAVSLSGTGSDTGAVASVVPWPMVRAVVASSSGTISSITATVGLA